MRGGKLDRTIVVRKRTIGRDSFGGADEAFTTFATVPAQVMYDRAGKLSRQNDAQVQAQSVVTFRIRYLAGVTREMRISFDGADYDITDVMEIGRRAGLDLRAVASVP